LKACSSLVSRGTYLRLEGLRSLGTVRFLGTFLEDPCDVPAGVMDFIAIQLGASIDGAFAILLTGKYRRPKR